MTPQAIFGISVLLGVVVWGLIGVQFTPTVLVPLLLVTHALVFRILLRPERVEVRHD
jgi:Flp pilus assembly protein TadB